MTGAAAALLSGSCSRAAEPQRMPGRVTKARPEAVAARETGADEVARPDRAQHAGPDAGNPIRRKLETIIIPEIDFRQANIVDVIEFLHRQSIIADESSPPDERGVNLILILGPPDVSAPEYPTEPPGNTDPSARGHPRRADMPALTLRARNISLFDAVRYVSEIAGLRYRVDRNAVVIFPEGAGPGEVVTRVYRVQPTILDAVLDRD